MSLRFHKDFFYIEPLLLGEDKTFPFQLYIFNSSNKEHTLFLHPNSPLDGPREKLLQFVLDRGGLLAINRKQTKSFLHSCNLNEADVPGLKQVEETQEEKNLKVAKYMLEKHRAEKPFNFHQELKAAILDNNFMQLIEEARLELCCFPVTISPTVSLAGYFADQLMIEDNFVNRTVTLCYFIAKILKIKDEESLADIVMASFLAHIGLTQMPYSMHQKSSIERTEVEDRLYRKHPGLTQHLLRKSKLNLSDRCQRIIIEHHERANGSGYPHNKVEDYLDILSLLLGAISHLLEQTSGIIDGKKKTFETVIKKISNKESGNGLEYEFGDTILDAIKTLLAAK